TEQSHTVNFVCSDYLALLQRRYLLQPNPLVLTQTDQDMIVVSLLSRANNPPAGAGGTPFYPASWLPLAFFYAAPDGTERSTSSGQLRDRTYLGGQSIGEAIDNLANVINGFDYDVYPRLNTANDRLRVFYPAQGVTRSDMALVYGSNVA